MRFSIRDMLWLTVVIAVLVAWWVDQRRLRQEVEQLRSQIPVAGFDIQDIEAFQSGAVP